MILREEDDGGNFIYFIYNGIVQNVSVNTVEEQTAHRHMVRFVLG